MGPLRTAVLASMSSESNASVEIIHVFFLLRSSRSHFLELLPSNEARSWRTPLSSLS